MSSSAIVASSYFMAYPSFISHRFDQTVADYGLAALSSHGQTSIWCHMDNFFHLRKTCTSQFCNCWHGFRSYPRSFSFPRGSHIVATVPFHHLDRNLLAFAKAFLSNLGSIVNLRSCLDLFHCNVACRPDATVALLSYYYVVNSCLPSFRFKAYYY